MMLKNPFRRNPHPPVSSADGGATEQGVVPQLVEQGMVYPGRCANLLTRQQVYLQQLDAEGYLLDSGEGWILPWEEAYRLLADAEHAEDIALLQLPPVLEVRAQLQSTGALSDQHFRIQLRGWILPNGRVLPGHLERIGAVFQHSGQAYLLPEACWKLLLAVRAFASEQQLHPEVQSNQLAWARIRQLALAGRATLDGFLAQTIVLQPEELVLRLRKSSLESTPVVEIEPGFAGQPAGWLQALDDYQQVQDIYHVSGADGSVTHVLIPASVKAVLQRVRSLPGRRVAGDAALTFLRNPYAVLGDDASKVIDPEQHEAQLQQAGIVFKRFSLQLEQDEAGKIVRLDLVMQPLTADQAATTLTFEQASDFAGLVRELKNKLDSQLPCGFWQGYELELSDFNREQWQGMQALLQRWQQQELGQWFGSVFDLSQYGERVMGIGVKEKVVSPNLPPAEKQTWLPESLLQECGLDVALLRQWDTACAEDFQEFVARIQQAEHCGADSVLLPQLELALTLPNARRLADSWQQQLQAKAGGSVGESEERVGLQVASHVEQADEKQPALKSQPLLAPQLPAALQAGTTLHPHQLEGVAWLQQLYGQSSQTVSGCLLADDMGLGKTLQLLTFICWYLEQDSKAIPVLIIAPVSLLDNWEAELNRFFLTGNLHLLKLYGKTLSQAKLRRQEIPQDLQEKGIHNLLRPDWLGGANIVLTTYETLRDQEMSLARQPWGVMICDEAQKIKNPGAMVTQSAKAIPARFRIACTGTPVENSLSDLWCLFDFVQPGLLGALNDFSSTYQRPQDCINLNQKAALGNLRALIEPLLLRRTKEQVANLPPKLEDQLCRTLAISSLQDRLYRSEMKNYQQQSAMLEQTGGRGVAMLGLLHTLKMICAHPHAIRPEGELIEASPKVRWLFDTLETIRNKGEKAIIFTELRRIQIDLKLALRTRFKLPDLFIMNGDTKASSAAGSESRQALIDRFQQQEGFGVIILSTAAVGFGVNIQQANHVIHFNRTWNPAKEDQATDRAYRIGQQKEVYVYYPTIIAPDYQTFEEKLNVLLTKKRELASDMLNGSGEVDMMALLDD
ncbi:DEAD/DEAH box helicase [Neisseriaceae bacterium TC5R-5]|nr:DEAD/DEAH box helicase [Neisseriaceae bacterium TC5R-5]